VFLLAVGMYLFVIRILLTSDNIVGTDCAFDFPRTMKAALRLSHVELTVMTAVWETVR
jgi:hypothetical protein